MSEDKKISLSMLSKFLDKIKINFAELFHTHTTSDIVDYKVDDALSETSTNPVQNKIVTESLDKKVDQSAIKASVNDVTDSDDLTKIIPSINVLSEMSEMFSEEFESKSNLGSAAYANIIENLGEETNKDSDLVSLGVLNQMENIFSQGVENNFALSIRAMVNGALENVNNYDFLKSGVATAAYLMDLNAILQEGTFISLDKGSRNKPVYFLDGMAVEISYTIDASVPANAKFTDTTYSVATTTEDGLMAAIDKEKLDSVENDANKTIVDQSWITNSTNPVSSSLIQSRLSDIETDINVIDNRIIGINAVLDDTGVLYFVSDTVTNGDEVSY